MKIFDQFAAKIMSTMTGIRCRSHITDSLRHWAWSCRKVGL